LASVFITSNWKSASVIEAMERLRATVEVLEACSAIGQQVPDSAHAKLLTNRAGEMAERLKAAVC
jgi:hypothetical protein